MLQRIATWEYSDVKTHIPEHISQFIKQQKFGNKKRTSIFCHNEVYKDPFIKYLLQRYSLSEKYGDV